MSDLSICSQICKWMLLVLSRCRINKYKHGLSNIVSHWKWDTINKIQFVIFQPPSECIPRLHPHFFMFLSIYLPLFDFGARLNGDEMNGMRSKRIQSNIMMNEWLNEWMMQEGSDYWGKWNWKENWKSCSKLYNVNCKLNYSILFFSHSIFRFFPYFHGN